MDAGSDLGSAAKGLAIDLELLALVQLAADFHSLLFLTGCSYLARLTFVTMVHRPSLLVTQKMILYDIHYKFNCAWVTCMRL